MSIRYIACDAHRKVVDAACCRGHETRHKPVTNTPCRQGPRVLANRPLYWKVSMSPWRPPNACRRMRSTPIGMRSSRG